MINFKTLSELAKGSSRSTATATTASSSTLIVDGTNTFVRAFIATHRTNRSGQHIGGIVGFLVSLGYAVDTFKPKEIIIVFDGAEGSVGRKLLYGGYKSNRQEKKILNTVIFHNVDEQEESREWQLLRLANYLKQMPVSMVCIDGVEADDVIGYVTKKKESEDRNVVIMSTDKDFFQLVNDKITVYNPTAKTVYKTEDIISRFGVHPNNFLTYRTFLGDKSDNIPNLDGFGPATVLKLFPELLNEEYVALEDIFKACEKQENSKKHLKITISKRLLLTNRRLMDLKEGFLSEDAKEDVDAMCNVKFKLNTTNFTLMHSQDNTDFPEATSWLFTKFSYLNK